MLYWSGFFELEGTMSLSHLVRFHHGVGQLRWIAFQSVVAIDQGHWKVTRPWKALVCSYEEHLWNQAEQICSERNFSSISRRNTVHAAGRPQACRTRLFIQQKNLLVASSFGLCTGLLRQREIDPKGFFASPKFIPVVDAINGIDLDDCGDVPCNLGGKSLQANPDLEMQKLQSRIIELEAQIKKMEDSVLVSSPPLAASTPFYSSNESEMSTNSISSSDSSVIEETLQSSLGPTRRKRKVPHQRRKITEERDGVLGKYHESLGCILGNSSRKARCRKPYRRSWIW